MNKKLGQDSIHWPNGVWIH